MEGSDCNPKSLPIHGKQIRKIPHSERNCLTPEEAQTVYDCLETEQVVSPIHFNKEIAKTPNPRKLAYQKLEEILEEEGSVNPYQTMIMGPYEHNENNDPFLHIDIYQPGPSSLNCMNIQNMENWSVLVQKCTMLILPRATTISWLWIVRLPFSLNGISQGRPPK